MKQWNNGEGEYFHEQGAFPQQLELEGKGFLLTSVGKSIGHVAFSSLVCRNDWLQTDESIAFSKAYSASRKWVNTANPQEVAYIEKDFFHYSWVVKEKTENMHDLQTKRALEERQIKNLNLG